MNFFKTTSNKKDVYINADNILYYTANTEDTTAIYLNNGKSHAITDSLIVDVKTTDLLDLIKKAN